MLDAKVELVNANVIEVKMAAYNGFMGNAKVLPMNCPECNKIANWEWEQQEFDDFGSSQIATCPECKTKFIEYSEVVDWEKWEDKS